MFRAKPGGSASLRYIIHSIKLFGTYSFLIPQQTSQQLFKTTFMLYGWAFIHWKYQENVDWTNPTVV